MTRNVTQVLSALRQDHKNMGLCLDFLEQESNRIYAGEDPDFELLHDALTYMTVYPDAVHHPREDRLYAELKAIRPELSKGFDRIASDHRQIAEDGAALKADFASVTSGSYVKRSRVVADALRYVNALRNHMQWEELDLFKRCDRMAREGHDLYYEDIYVSRRDPMFSEQTEKRFERLFDAIRDALGADRS